MRRVVPRLSNAPSVEPALPGSPAQESSFAVAYRTTIGFVRRVVQRQAISPADWDDAVQDVFLVAYRRWDQLDSAASLHAWLHGIAVRTCCNYRRARRRWNDRLLPGDEPAEAQPDRVDRIPAAELERREELQWLRDAMARLDEKQRRALVLVRLERRSAAEVSRMTGLSPNTVASRLRAALVGLRQAATARESPGVHAARLASKK